MIKTTLCAAILGVIFAYVAAYCVVMYLFWVFLGR